VENTPKPHISEWKKRQKNIITGNCKLSQGILWDNVESAYLTYYIAPYR